MKMKRMKHYEMLASMMLFSAGFVLIFWLVKQILFSIFNY